MTTFITSDIHFSHKSIIKYCPERRQGRVLPPDDTPEFDVEVTLMNELIVSNWNSMVRPEDEVWILGDVAMGQIKFAPGWIRQLNGKKHLVKGNHDKTLVKLPEFSELFVSVQNYKELSVKVDGKKHMLCMSHFPMTHWNSMNSDLEKTSIHFHGHLHSDRTNLHRHQGAIVDVGMDGNGLFPRNLNEAISLALKMLKKILLKVTTIRQY